MYSGMRSILWHCFCCHFHLFSLVLTLMSLLNLIAECFLFCFRLCYEYETITHNCSLLFSFDFRNAKKLNFHCIFCSSRRIGFDLDCSIFFLVSQRIEFCVKPVVCCFFLLLKTVESEKLGFTFVAERDSKVN